MLKWVLKQNWLKSAMVLKSSLFFLLFSILAPHFVWGFSLERTENYKKTLLEKKLYQDPQWLRLGHYHKSWTGSYHSKIRGNFFLAPNGAKDPQAELLATVDQLFKDSDKPLQCRYLARMRWLKSVLPIYPDDIATCQERDDWKKSLAASEAYIVFAASDLSSPASSFGHTFLRFHNPENTHQLELLDYGVNYAALTGKDTGATFALKGLFGFYPGTYSMLPYHEKMREYTNLEGRDLWEYKLKLSDDEVAMLIDHLLELDSSFSYYYFADENCSFQIMELLNVVKPLLDLTSSYYVFVIPLDTLRLLEQEQLLEGEKSRPSLQAEWRRRYSLLNLTEKKELRSLVDAPLTFAFQEGLNNIEKAETLEAGLSYLSIKEYREQKELKDDKYALAVQRSKLGLITQPVQITPPSSPLLSARANGLYLGYGKDRDLEFYDLKLRRTFHDLLSDDTGFPGFFHLEVMSFEFRYYQALKNLDLYRWTIAKILSTPPMNILDHPISWSVDIGTEPKLSPYVNIGAGSSFDLPLQTPSRWTILGLTENKTEQDTYSGYFGIQNLLIQKWRPYLRTLLDSSYLYSTKSHEFIWDHQVGMSLGKGPLELRMTYQKRDQREQSQLTLIRFF
jgi:hypothetical protein